MAVGRDSSSLLHPASGAAPVKAAKGSIRVEKSSLGMRLQSQRAEKLRRRRAPNQVARRRYVTVFARRLRAPADRERRTNSCLPASGTRFRQDELAPDP